MCVCGRLATTYDRHRTTTIAASLPCNHRRYIFPHLPTAGTSSPPRAVYCLTVFTPHGDNLRSAPPQCHGRAPRAAPRALYGPASHPLSTKERCQTTNRVSWGGGRSGAPEPTRGSSAALANTSGPAGTARPEPQGFRRAAQLRVPGAGLL